MADNEIRATIRAQISDFAAKMEESARIAQQTAAELEATFGKAGETVPVAMANIGRSAQAAAEESKGAFATINEAAESAETALKGLAGIFLVGAALEFANKLRETIGAANETEIALLHLSERTGVTVERMNQLAGVAALVDVPVDSLARVMTMLSRQMVMAEQGSKNATEAFQAFGLSIDDLRGKSVDQVFLAIADAVSQSKDSIEKLGELSTLLGARMGTQLIPLLQQGSAAIREQMAAIEQLNPVTKQQTEEADELHKTWLGLEAVTQSFARSLLSALSPAIQHIENAMIGWIEIAKLLGHELTNILHPITAWHEGTANMAADLDAMRKLAAIPAPEIGGGQEVQVGSTSRGASAHQLAAEAHRGIEEKFRAFQQEAQLEIAEAQNNAVQKVAILDDLAEKTKRLFGEESAEYRRVKIEEQNAVNEVDKQLETDARKKAEDEARSYNQRLHNFINYLNEQAREQEKAQRQIDQGWAKAQGEFDKFVEAMRGGTRGLISVFEELGLKIAESLIGAGIQEALHALIGLHESAQLAAARQAGAEAAQAVAGIPIVGPVLAPIAAATVFAAAMAFEQGGVVPGRPGEPVPAILHAGEFVIPRTPSLPSLSAADFSRGSPAAAMAAAVAQAGGQPGGGTHIHHHSHVESADPRSVERWFAQNKRAIGEAVARYVRDGSHMRR